jgi:hypothetical protein
MEDWVHRALARWPNVPALYGWLGLDRRGRWLIRGELISRPQIIDTIARNYAADEQGRWYFQNGPQRGYVALESAPLVLRVAGDGERLETHTGLTVQAPTAAYLDEEGSLMLATEHGPAALESEDLAWALERLADAAGLAIEDALGQALSRPSGSTTSLSLSWSSDPSAALLLLRLDRALAPSALGFVRDPQPQS